MSTELLLLRDGGRIGLVASPRHLDFALLDDFVLAVQNRSFNASSLLGDLTLQRIGPLVELFLVSRNPGCTLDFNLIRDTPVLSRLRKATGSRANYGRCSDDETAGFILTNRNPKADDSPTWTGFCLAAQQAAIDSGLVKEQAKGLIGAMREIEENIHLHSDRSHDGIVGYRTTKGEFEFVVADSGIGALASLRQSPDYQDVTDAGAAIRLALTDGESRLKHQRDGHGYGFRGLFVGLANLNSDLRFRSDDHSLTINGDSPSLKAGRLDQTGRLQGFFVNVVCRSARALQLH